MLYAVETNWSTWISTELVYVVACLDVTYHGGTTSHTDGGEEGDTKTNE